MNYIEALTNRYSVKKFDANLKVSSEVLMRILQAGKLSASSLGLQPYKILVVGSAEKLTELHPAFCIFWNYFFSNFATISARPSVPGTKRTGSTRVSMLANSVGLAVA